MLIDAPPAGPCPVAVLADTLSESAADRRGELLAAAIERSPHWLKFVASMRLREVAIGGAADLDPISRAIAEHFSCLAPHQRPEKADAAAAVQRIEVITRMLRWLASDTQGCQAVQDGGAAAGVSAAAGDAFPHRCLAPLYFPKKSSGWRAIVDGVLACSLQEVAVRMLDRLSGGELAAYLSQTVDRTTDVDGIVRGHFAADLPSLCLRLTSGPEWRDGAVPLAGIRLAGESAESAARWEVLWQWAAGESFIAMPAALKSDAVDWESVARRHASICEHLGRPRESRRGGRGESMATIFSPRSGEAVRPAEVALGTSHESERGAAEGTQATPDSPRCEVRMADDPGLSQSMRAALDRYRVRGESLSLVRLCAIGSDGAPSQSDGRKLAPWHDAVMVKLEGLSCGELALAFLTSQGDLGLLVGGLERSELARKLRTELLAVGISAATASEASTSYGLVAGAATVANPHRHCELDQLFAAVDRCVQGALLQGRGAVKSLDVF